MIYTSHLTDSAVSKKLALFDKVVAESHWCNSIITQKYTKLPATA